MEQTLTVLLTLGILGWGSLQLRGHSGRTDSNFVFWSWIILIHLTLLLMQVITYYANWENPFFNFLSLVFYGLLLAVPPSLYFYQKVHLSDEKQLHLTDLGQHYLPAIALLIINVFGFFIMTYGEEGSIFQTYSEEIIFFLNFLVITFLFLLQNVFYLLLGVKNYMEQRKTSESVSRSILALLGLYCAFLLTVYFQQITSSGYTGWELSLIVSAFCLSLNYVHGKFQSPIVKVADKGKMILKPIAVAGTSSSDNLLPLETTQQIQDRLRIAMDEEKIYTRPELSIAQLAKAADTNVKYLRYVIHTVFDDSFVTFINEYRVKEAQKMLSDEEHSVYTIESIGRMAGFKSKSSFYVAFKERVGMTPSQFRRQCNTLTEI